MRHYHLNNSGGKHVADSFSPSNDPNMVSVVCEDPYMWLDMSDDPPYPWHPDSDPYNTERMCLA